jgi:hypothetical protein
MSKSVASPTGRVEGARREASDGVDRCLHRPTPSKPPLRRPFAARTHADASVCRPVGPLSAFRPFCRHAAVCLSIYLSVSGG